MTVSSKHTQEFIYRCQRQLELLSRREDFTSWVEAIRFRFQTKEKLYIFESWNNNLKELDYLYLLENGEPNNRKESLMLPSEQFRLVVKTVMLDSKLDNFWYQPLVNFILTNSISKAISVLPPNNGISVDYEWDQRYGGETIKLSIGMTTNKKQLNEAMSVINELQIRYGGKAAKELKATRPRRVLARDLMLYDLSLKKPSETTEDKKKILETVNQTVEKDEDIIGYEKFDTIVDKIAEEIQTII